MDDDFHHAWVDLWSTDASPKVRHFVWRLCTNTLPTRALLRHRHLLNEAPCPWCEGLEESIRHMLFECSRVKEFWEELGCKDLV
ncbi:Methionyl-tRNA formyltransferase [Bienertia sinuspersici]